VTPGEELVGEVLLHQHFDDHGLVRVSSLALYEGLRSETDAVIGISLWNEAGWVRTHARIIDLAKLEQWLTARGRIPNPAWLTMLDEQTSGVLQSLARVINDPTHGAHVGWRNEVIKKLPAWFGEYASELFACACALTPDTPIGEPWTPALNFLPASNQYRLVVEWAIHARDAIANWDDDRIADSGLLHEFDLLSWRSPCEAWEDYVRELQKKLVGRQTLLPMLEEWKAEVTAGARDGEPGEWRSQISRMTGGNALCSAFFHNLKSDGQLDETRRGSLVEAYQKARSVSAIAPAPSSIVTALAWMLQLLALHKYGPASARMELLPARCPKNLIPLLDSLQSNRTTLMRIEDIDAALVLLDRLPLPAEDCERIRSGLAKPTSASTRTTQ
jgi:hypothetical protein